MAFLDKFSDRGGYRDANIYQFIHDRPEVQYQQHYGPDGPPPPSQYGNRGMFGSRGMIDKMGQRNEGPSGNPISGLLGIQNTTGFSQEAPNVVYDQQPEQFEKQLKLQKENLGIERMKAEGILEQNRALNESRMQNADANTLRAQVADYRARNPNSLIKEMADGIYAVDPQTNQVTRLGGGMAGQKFGYDYALGDQRNQGNMDVQGLRNTGAMETTEARNKAMIEAVGLRNANAETLEKLRQSGSLDRLLQSLGTQKNNAIFKEKGNIYRTQLKEGLINPEDPVEGRPPEYPRGDINLPSPPQNAPALNSTPGGSIGNILSGAQAPVQIPSQQTGFTAAPNQYNAAPGQYSGQVKPFFGGQVSGSNDKEIEAQAVAELTRANQKVTPANIQYMMQQIKAKGGTPMSSTTSGQPAAGQLGGISAGTVTGPSAGSVR